MFELAQALAVAKSRQDVPAAMELFHRDMVLQAPAFGTTARGPAANEKALIFVPAGYVPVRPEQATRPQSQLPPQPLCLQVRPVQLP